MGKETGDDRREERAAKPVRNPDQRPTRTAKSRTQDGRTDVALETQVDRTDRRLHRADRGTGRDDDNAQRITAIGDRGTAIENG